MELGEKLRQARLEAGLSQRQLCGDIITRNMLSQIENGSAKPSFATLQALCARLSKPVSYFWEQAPSENLSVLYAAAQLPPEQALTALEQYLPGDPLLDEGYRLLRCQLTLALARQVLAEKKNAYACALLEQARELVPQLPSCQEALCRELTLLRYLAGQETPSALAEALPDNTLEQQLRAAAALSRQDGEKCLAFLDGADRQTEEMLLLRADALILLQRYDQAVACLAPLESAHSAQVYPRLEICYRELGDYKKAYEYACIQR